MAASLRYLVARVRIHDLDGDHLTGTIDAVLADSDLTQALVMAGFVKAIIHHENAGYAYPDAVLAEGVRRALA